MVFHLVQRSILMLLSMSCIWVLKQRQGAFVFPLLLYLLGIFEQVFSSFQYCFTCGIRQVNTFYTFVCPFKRLHWSLNLIFLWPLQACSCCQPFHSSPQLHHKDPSHGKLQRSASLQASQNQLHDLQDL